MISEFHSLAEYAKGMKRNPADQNVRIAYEFDKAVYEKLMAQRLGRFNHRAVIAMAQLPSFLPVLELRTRLNNSTNPLHICGARKKTLARAIISVAVTQQIHNHFG